jgi:ElaB/YqjD/DUF883 family membrane-anchored ribosome-binding protein
VAFAGVTCRFKDSRGLHYLALLLQHPRQEFSVVTLAASDPVPPAPTRPNRTTATAARLDPQLHTVYRQRLVDLREELEEARAFHDQGRIERLQDELETLTQELTEASGQGGRKAVGPAEQARLNVTRAIRRTLRKITTLHPPLGQYLSQTIKTGTVCVYNPAPDRPVTWQF